MERKNGKHGVAALETAEKTRWNQSSLPQHIFGEIPRILLSCWQERDDQIQEQDTYLFADLVNRQMYTSHVHRLQGRAARIQSEKQTISSLRW